MTFVLVLLGGAVGAPLRYLTDLFVQARHDSVFPWGTLSVNVVGSLLFGGLGSAVADAGAPAWLMTMVGTGFCGALTTFSTFGFETVRLVEEGSWVAAVLNVTASVVLSLVAVFAGWGVVSALW
jgi:CrcB protein